MGAEHFFTFGKIDYVRNKHKEEGCVFCKMAANPGSNELLVYHDRLFLVVLNLYPYNPAHLLILPTRHVKDIRELTDEEGLALFKLEKDFLNILEKIYSPKGFNIGYNLGQVAGGSQSHLHLHIIPRYANEVGVAELIGGAKVLVEDPRVSRDKIRPMVKSYFFDQERAP